MLAVSFIGAAHREEAPIAKRIVISTVFANCFTSTSLTVSSYLYMMGEMQEIVNKKYQ
jgi:hypothetical protein